MLEPTWPLSEAITRRFLSDLEVDLAISRGQLERHYGLLEFPEGVITYTTLMALSHGARREQKVQFALHPSQVGTRRHELRHLCGVGELRRVLGIEAGQEWRSEAHRTHRGAEPDGEWTANQGRFALEYDTGSYSPDTLREKLHAFARRYRGQCWGFPTEVRRFNFVRLADREGVPVRAVVAPWL